MPAMLQRAKRTGKQAKIRRPRFQLEVEALEQRCLLSAGSLDLTFGQNGVANLPSDGAVRAIVVEGDGKLLVLDQSSAGYDVFRLNTDGSLDTTFGNQGEVSAAFGSGTVVVGIGILPDGRIVVGGGHGFQPGANNPDETQPAFSYVDVACFNSDGTVDSTFGNGGIAEVAYGGNVSSPSDIVPVDFAVAPDGRIVVAATSGNALAVVRLNTDGSLDQSFGDSGVVAAELGAGAQAGGVAVQSDGKIVASGFGVGQFQVLRFNADGSSDQTFGENGAFSTALTDRLAGSRLAVDAASGMIVVAADTFSHPYGDVWWSESHLTLWRLQADGQPDASFGTDGQVSPSQAFYSELPTFPVLALQNDGKILVATQGNTALVTRYNADGSLDLSFGNGGSVENSSAWWSGNINPWPAIALQGDGKVILASEITTDHDNLVSQNLVVSRFDVDSDIRPTPFGSEDALRQYLINQAVQQYGSEFGQPVSPWIVTPYLGVPGTVMPLDAVAGASAAAGATAAPTYSTTNTQEQGVDEGDTVKTDGQYLYVLANNYLVILGAWPAASLSTLSTTYLPGSALVEYLDGNRLTVISRDYEAQPPPNWSHPVVDVTVYDVFDPSAPVVVQQTTLEGSYNNSRAIGDTVYVAVDNENLSLPAPQITQVGPNSYAYETKDAYIARMEALSLNTLLPHYTTQNYAGGSKLTQSGLLTDIADVYQPAVLGDNYLISLVALDLTGTAAGPTASASFLTSSSATLYAASDNFYLITNRWSFVSDYSFIDKLSLAGGGITLAATGEVPGNIINQFAVGEDGAYLDIATTSGSWGTWDNTTNHIYVLAQTGALLNIVGQTEDLAPGESIYSVRFLGDRAFVSTFMRIDPLFAVDLSNPSAPRIAGSLEISGYTNYLQAIDATHLIGIGEDVDPNTQQSKGLDISLFDISDLANPILLSRYEVSMSGPAWWGEYSYDALANFDYHAIKYYPESQTLTLPFTLNQSFQSWPEEEPGVATSVVHPDIVAGVAGGMLPIWDFGQYSSLAAQLVLHVDTASGTLELDGQVSDTSSIQRGVFIGSMLYSISGSSVQVHDLGDLTTLVAQVPLPNGPIGPGGVGGGHGTVPVLPPVEIKPIYVVFPQPPVQEGQNPLATPPAPVGPFLPGPIGPVAQPELPREARLAEHTPPAADPTYATSTRSLEAATAIPGVLTAAPVIMSPTSAVTAVIAVPAEPENQFLALPIQQASSIFTPREDHEQSAPGGWLITGQATLTSSLDPGGASLPSPQNSPEANPSDFGQTSTPSEESSFSPSEADVFFTALAEEDAETLIDLAGW